MSEIVVVLLSANLLLLLFLIFRAQPKTSGDSSQALTFLQNQMGSLSQAMADGATRMQDSMRIQQGQLADAASRMQEGMRQQHGEALRLANEIRSAVDRQLTEVAREVSATKESTQQVFQLAEQLQNLERVLKHQKQRGNLGERSLELILSNMLPPGAYRMQHELPGGETVDAVIMAREGLIPIDAKFPLDNYVRLLEETDEVRRVEHERAFRNDLKLRIDETAKYVRPRRFPSR
jgi:DNA recombination protein RmuC